MIFIIIRDTLEFFLFERHNMARDLQLSMQIDF